MRRLLILGTICLLLLGFTWSVAQKEKLRSNGREVLLELAPVDPRALLMGEYMTLDFALNRDLSDALRAKYGTGSSSRRRGGWGRSMDFRSDWPSSGLAVIRLTTEAGAVETRRGRSVTLPAGVAVFVRLDDGSPLADGEMHLFYRVHGGRAQVASSAFYFQEGHAQAYERARYGLIRLDGMGKNLLMSLCDDAGKPIARPVKVQSAPAQGSPR